MTPRGKGTLVAVDGTALAYRSHFAFINRPLTTKSGEVTSAVFGFILTLRRILDELKPERFVVVFDPPGPTFRHKEFPEYKAQRERMPSDLRQQLPRIHEWLDASGLPRLSVDGFEADDVLATLARRGTEAGGKAIIVSNDKDLLQMVGDGIEVAALGRGGSEPLRRMGPDEVREAHGVGPERIVDYLTLTGDASDNVPGVPGVGKKTAASLIAQYGSLDKLLSSVDDMKKGKLRENLRASRDTVRTSRALIELRLDVPTEDVDSFRIAEPDAAALDALYEELDFQSLRKEAPGTTPSDRSGYGVAAAEGEVRELASEIRKAGRFSFAIVASEGDRQRAGIVGIAFGTGEGRARYVPLAHTERRVTWDTVREHLGPLFEDESLPKWGQDVKRQLLLLARDGLEPRGIDFDTMLASYVLDPSRRNHDLEAQARDRLNVERLSRKDLTGTGRKKTAIAEAPVEDVADWAGESADIAFRLRGVLEPELDAQELAGIMQDVELPLLGVLRRMEARGVRLDTEHLAKLSRDMEKEIAELEKKAWAAAGEEFNLASPKQVGELLFGKLGLKPLRRTKTGHSTDADVLTALSEHHEVPGLLLRHREVSKLKSTYVDALPALVNPDTGRIHTTFQQAVAATGRLSSADPNLQNVPVRTAEGRGIRKAFVPEPGWVLVSCDYSQIELRILAHMAQDEPLLAAFRRDRDIHRATAAQVFDVPEDDVTSEQRGQAKTINYAVLYGMGAVNLGKSLGIPTREASGFIEAYFDRYPGVAGFVETMQEKARKDLYVETLLGRRRPIPEIASADHRTRAFGERIAVNTPIQGTAADIMKLAMIRVQAALDDEGLEAALLLTVHDELVLECPKDEREAAGELVRDRMERAMTLTVPLKVDAGWGADWSEAH
ncbi:MAG TPA: DNA polymerase I [bacterium]|nr:DNA polymerase I [bacterium]